MKKIFVFFALFCALIFATGCGGSSKNNNQNENPDSGDTKTDDDGDSDADTSSQDSETNDSDSQDSKQGELYGECYPNKTCNDGLECDAESNICIKDNADNDSDLNPDNDSDDTASDNDAEITDSDNDADTEPTDPCVPNPCSGIEKSTEICNVFESIYTCECEQNYYWDGSLCGTTQTQIASCTDLPDGAEWNTVSQIIQTWDDYLGTWVPSSTGSYNENPSTNQCRFKCKENYNWEPPNCVAAYTCLEIYQCFEACSDQACIDACTAKGTPTDQDLFNTMYDCWKNICADDYNFECIAANCANESEACGLFKPADTTYPAPYGTLQINVASTYIVTSETQLNSSIINMSSFATGNLGSSDIVPAGPLGSGSMSYYYAALVTNNGNQYIQIVQYYTDTTGHTQLNPGIIIQFPATAVPGTAHFGLDRESVGQMYIADLNGNQVTCYHGFGYGDLTITSVNPAAGAAGNVSMNGTIEIYNAVNAPMYGGDISSLINNWVNCAVR